MSAIFAFPKPKDIRKKREAVITYPDGRQVCDIETVHGVREYATRIRAMVARQNNRCCLEAYAPMCTGYLSENHATFEHENGRGHGGGKRDDRICLPDGTWVNGAAHRSCNQWKGSRYINYNRGFQPCPPKD